MNKHEIQTIRQEAQRFMKDISLVIEDSAIRLVLPFLNSQSEEMYFFVVKRKESKKFSLLIPVQSVGILAIESTLALLQPVLKTYGLLLSQDAVIMEESKLSLHKRIGNVAQALIAIDGVRRLWKVEHDRRTENAIESESIEPISDPTNDSSPR
jgi:hypothetical protein